jgi:hypothetical protein
MDHKSEVVMWEHYRKTFVGIQSMIVVITGGMLYLSHSLTIAAVFLLIMETGAVVGAMWAQRLKHKLAHQLSAPRARRI